MSLGSGLGLAALLMIGSVGALAGALIVAVAFRPEKGDMCDSRREREKRGKPNMSLCRGLGRTRDDRRLSRSRSRRSRLQTREWRYV